MLSSSRGDAGPILRSTSITMFVVDVEARIFDFDNHYYESEDALTRHQDKALGNRGVRWADIGGRRRLLVGGKINSYIANPTFDPVARPGSLYDWYRGNPRRQKITQAFGGRVPTAVRSCVRRVLGARRGGRRRRRHARRGGRLRRHRADVGARQERELAVPLAPAWCAH